ncbi:hypothetical protein N9Z12_05250 [Opitutaceae bacterium]|nr:hypothetical protein [Opitutaceae bacterium]
MLAPIYRFKLRLALALVALPLIASLGLNAQEPTSTAGKSVVTYEQFGAVGDGLADDLPAIAAAHAFANKQNLPVRSEPTATYHLGRQALTAVIKTSTDWNTSRFIINDSLGVEDNKQSLFEVRSQLEPVPITIKRLAVGQAQLDQRPDTDLLVYVEDDTKRRFIRRGLNVNSGTAQKEVFILRQDGTIEGAIEWDYETISRVEAWPIDPEPLTLSGGFFINIANRMEQDVGYNYWSRNIEISRSNTVVDGLSYEVVGQTDVGHPYRGFLAAEQVAHITLRDCHISPHKVYKTIGRAGLPVSMGTYGYSASLVVNFTMQGCRMGDIHNTALWGIAGTNFMKNLLVEDCMLSRMDVHMGVSGFYIIRRSTLGHMGVNAIGKGQLIVEDSTIHSQRLIKFRADYGATWDGDVLVRNSRWVPPRTDGSPVAIFGVQNDGTHDFGYTSSMPTSIRIEGLTIDDGPAREGESNIVLFDDPSGALDPKLPHAYRPTERVEIKDLTTTSGLTPRVSEDPKLTEIISVSGL